MTYQSRALPEIEAALIKSAGDEFAIRLIDLHTHGFAPEVSRGDVSDSLVQSIGFSEGPFVIEAPPEGVETLQQLLVNLSIETSSYATLEAFIDEIEKLDRILIVDNISFSSPGEVTTEELEPAKLQLSLSFTAFFANLRGRLEQEFAAAQLDACEQHAGQHSHHGGNRHRQGDRASQLELSSPAQAPGEDDNVHLSMPRVLEKKWRDKTS